MEPTTQIGIIALLLGFGIYVITQGKTMVKLVQSRQALRGLDSTRVSQLDNGTYKVKSKELHDFHLDKLDDFGRIEEMCNEVNQSLQIALELTRSPHETFDVHGILTRLNQDLDILSHRMLAIQQRQAKLTKVLMDNHFAMEGLNDGF